MTARHRLLPPAAIVRRERDRGEDGGPPGAEVLGREAAAEGLLEVPVDVGGADVVPPVAARGTRAVPRRRCGAASARASTRDDVSSSRTAMSWSFPLLPGSRRPAGRRADREVLLAQRRQPDGLVRPAYSSVPTRKNPRSSIRTAQASTRSRSGSPPAPRSVATRCRNAGSASAKLDHADTSRGRAGGATRRGSGTACGRRRRYPSPAGGRRVVADPDVLPGGRDAEPADALQQIGIGQPLAVRVDVAEAPPAPAAGDPGQGAVASPHAWHGRIVLPGGGVRQATPGSAAVPGRQSLTSPRRWPTSASRPR